MGSARVVQSPHRHEPGEIVPETYGAPVAGGSGCHGWSLWDLCEPALPVEHVISFGLFTISTTHLSSHSTYRAPSVVASLLELAREGTTAFKVRDSMHGEQKYAFELGRGYLTLVLLRIGT